jgi:hypothetical protein
MEETREMQKLHGFLQCAIYMLVVLEAVLFVYLPAPIWGLFAQALLKIQHIPIYQELVYSKFATLTLICLVSIGTLAKKKIDLDPKKHILYPLSLGLLLLFGSMWFYNRPSVVVLPYTSWYNLAYMACSVLGALITSLAMDNVSKMIRSGLGKDKWNVEQESFMQPVAKIETPYSVNIPMQFYYKGKVRDGWINVVNPFRGTLLIGTPGSGKSYGVVNSYIRQMIAKQYCACIYDFKFPDLGKIAYYQYLLAKQQGKCGKHQFHVINLNEVEKSRRVNPWSAKYLRTLADASESAEGLVEAMKKGDKSGGSDQFFTQSAINFLTACVYFFAKFQQGKFSSFPHVLSFLNCSYEEIFSTLFSEPELSSLLSPFRCAYKLKAFDQLEGQVGTLKIFISRLATKETFWVFSGDDFDLKISSKTNPSILILANDPSTQSTNSASYSVILNRITSLINSKGNNPVGLLIDEAPSLYTHKVENLISQARSNLSAVLLGMQELPMLNQQYGKDTAATITSVVGNIMSGSVRNKDTLEWLERLLGKSKQIGEGLSIDRNKTSSSLNEKLEALIPAGKIASLNTGEMVGLIASDAEEKFTGKFETSAVNCRINLNRPEIEKEEKNYRELPTYYDFSGKKEEILLQNFFRINKEVEVIVRLFSQSEAAQPLPKVTMGSPSAN